MAVLTHSKTFVFKEIKAYSQKQPRWSANKKGLRTGSGTKTTLNLLRRGTVAAFLRYGT